MPGCNDARLPLHQIAGYRGASALDVQAIASLHADSWRRHYRGAYLDSFLDGDVVSDRLAIWSERLNHPRMDQYTIVAEIDRDVVGFVHIVFDQDPSWGTLLDNLHVTSGLKRHGIGSQLLIEAARGLLRRRPSGSFYLWVLDQNKPAQSFYKARGGMCVESKILGPFAGGGKAPGHRYAWPDPHRLLSDDLERHNADPQIDNGGQWNGALNRRLETPGAPLGIGSYRAGRLAVPSAKWE